VEEEGAGGSESSRSLDALKGISREKLFHQKLRYRNNISTMTSIKSFKDLISDSKGLIFLRRQQSRRFDFDKTLPNFFTQST
jgi:hypothetical protein